ncbi:MULTISPECIES: Imm2 family immunity protein [unclassified Pseudomonas]|uniref:Imm2 family immunity protein n=1 Tax=unclassified Pseudomonas TaxID=196821 RepID=UPI000BCAB2DA|nr:MULTISPECIES: Imm2 family immunity protein [unclassified Pseudomonas]PVZ15420.1 immunity protein Imm2 of predicted polymorphic toxin system [Pseudomonas sp. URIL14HWK12:I12]PVZ24794.1 immunity protein Imm2 of predicted polymorphic toxin system [Pseudomonas sp. URIL14HWK12:I10]PVZ34640.1 immunity protein Imm2 of predicted polymorphic toxin system [Pseudomonas sp. URIL14HWK12:I11]SNZ08839.1 Immunity protein Imm2 [Pseudomonas sp. URIL14HWK12:I9]
MEDRVTYGEIRAWFLGRYYSYCKVKLSHQSSWAEGESEVGYAYGELENSFELPVERLMLEVTALILSAGRSPEKVKEYHLHAISKLLDDIELSYILEGLPSDEVAELKDDLKLLGIG